MVYNSIRIKLLSSQRSGLELSSLLPFIKLEQSFYECCNTFQGRQEYIYFCTSFSCRCKASYLCYLGKKNHCPFGLTILYRTLRLVTYLYSICQRTAPAPQAYICTVFLDPTMPNPPIPLAYQRSRRLRNPPRYHAR